MNRFQNWVLSDIRHNCGRCAPNGECDPKVMPCEAAASERGWFSAYLRTDIDTAKIVAIDPDHEKSGLAEFDLREKRFTYIDTLTFPQVLAYLSKAEKSTRIVVEASWHVTHNWHVAGMYGSQERAASIGHAVGLNHQTGMDIISAAQFFGLNAEEQNPLRKCWKGRDGKITAEEIKAITGHEGRTNQEQRDAMLIAWVVAGQAIKM